MSAKDVRQLLERFGVECGAKTSAARMVKRLRRFIERNGMPEDLTPEEMEMLQEYVPDMDGADEPQEPDAPSEETSEPEPEETSVPEQEETSEPEEEMPKQEDETPKPPTNGTKRKRKAPKVEKTAKPKKNPVKAPLPKNGRGARQALRELLLKGPVNKQEAIKQISAKCEVAPSSVLNYIGEAKAGKLGLVVTEDAEHTLHTVE